MLNLIPAQTVGTLKVSLQDFSEYNSVEGISTTEKYITELRWETLSTNSAGRIYSAVRA